MGLILGSDSPFRRLPVDLDGRQSMFLEGFRYAIEMANLSYERLNRSLEEFEQRESGVEAAHVFVSAFLDAWSLIDSVNRLRNLLVAARGIKKKSAGVQRFLRNTAEVESMRHAVQHMDRELSNAADAPVTVWGTLSWALMASDRTQACVLAITPGATYDGITPVVNPAGRIFHASRDLITLSAASTQVDLSAVHREVSELAQGLNRAVDQAFKEQIPTNAAANHHGSDVLLKMKIEFPPNN